MIFHLFFGRFIKQWNALPKEIHVHAGSVEEEKVVL